LGEAPNSFWVGGPKAYQRGLSEYHRTTRRTLDERLNAAQTGEQREAIEAEIRTVEKEYREKVAGITYCLF
jgi:hypothetical protein